MATATLDSLVEDAKGRLIEWRRHLHRNPKVSFHEERTARFVRETLESFGGLEISHPTLLAASGACLKFRRRPYK